MPSLLTLAVAFAGIGGPSPSKIDHQVRQLLASDTDVVDAEITAKQRHLLVSNDPGSSDILSQFDQPSLVTGEIDKKGKKVTVVVYGHDGSMIDLLELPVHKHKLAKNDLDSLRDTLIPDVEKLDQAPSKKKHKHGAPVAQATDDEVPAGEDGATVASSDPTPPAKDDDDVPGVVHTAEAPAATGKSTTHSPRIHVALGFGPRGRTFMPGPAAVKGYRTKPVPSGELDVAFTPSRFAEIDAAVEHTVVMESALDTGNVASSILRWQATGALKLPAGAMEVAAIGGIGSRDFVINAPAPTPDSHYVYAIVGGRLTAHLGKKIAVVGHGAYEPVIGGTQTVMMPSGTASRAGFEVGGEVDVSVSRHLMVIAGGGYQQFMSKWTEGTATDAYPSGTLSLGAQY